MQDWFALVWEYKYGATSVMIGGWRNPRSIGRKGKPKKN